jgi:hypothetical protein
MVSDLSCAPPSTSCRSSKIGHHDQEITKTWSRANKYKAPATTPTNRDGKNLKENDSRDRNTINNSVTQVIHTKIMHCYSAKEMWDKLKTIYEGDAKFKEAKL